MLSKYYPEDEHVFVFDNTTTHLKRADDALSATKMPKGTSSTGSSWGVLTTFMGENGLPVHGNDGKIQKVKVKMTGGYLH